MQSKTIDSVKDRRACAWGVVGCCSILPRQLSRPLTVVTNIVPDRSPNPTAELLVTPPPAANVEDLIQHKAGAF